MLKPFFDPNEIEAGCDEAGRGCLAGPVFAAAVILPHQFQHPLLNDSKKLSAFQRKLLRPIIEQQAIAWSVARVDRQKIDQINILNAAFLAMHRAVDHLKVTPSLLLIDGNKFNPYPNIAHQCIIKGDGKYRSIAAASILAKTHRDELMEKLANQFPHYNWKSNKGYPTKAHRQAIQVHGVTKYHRLSFRLLPTDKK
ncbi:MAG: ribonuclease HII [Bacteroidota bacterium]